MVTGSLGISVTAASPDAQALGYGSRVHGSALPLCSLPLPSQVNAGTRWHWESDLR